MEEIQKHYVAKGRIIKLMVYNRYSMKTLRIILTEGKGRFREAEKLIASHSEAQTGCPVTYTYTRNSVKKLFISFDIKNQFVDYIFPWEISNYVQYKYVKIPVYRWVPDFLFRFPERCFSRHLYSTAKAWK